MLLSIAAYYGPFNHAIIPFPSSPITGLDLLEKLALSEWSRQLRHFAVPNEPFEDKEGWWEAAHNKTVEERGLEKWCRIYRERDLIDFSSKVSKGMKVINAFGIYPVLEYHSINVALNYENFNEVIQIRAHSSFEIEDLDWTIQLSHNGYRTYRRKFASAYWIPIDTLPSSLRPIGLALVLQNYSSKAWTEGSLVTACGWLANKDIIHVIVSPTTYTPPNIISPIQDLQQKFLKLSVNNVTPSTGGKVENFLTRQSQLNYFKCGRPAERAPIYPPSLYSDICARAIDARNEEPTELDERIFMALNPAMRNIYEVEEWRTSKIRSVFNNEDFEFHTYSVQEPVRSSQGGSEVRTSTPDIRLYVGATVDVGSFLAQYAYVEVKNETGTGGGAAFFEGLVDYFAGSKEASEHRVNSHLPAILMTIVGNTLSVHFCVFVERPISQLLTEYTFGYDESDEAQRYRGLQTIHVLTTALQQLCAHYQSPSFINPPEDYQPHFPYPRACKSASPSGEVITFTYDGFLDSDPNRHYRLFKVTLGDGRRAIVKFAQRYGLEAHQAAEKLGLSPELIGYQELSAGWKMVLMEDLSSMTIFDIHTSKSLRALFEEKVGKFHDEGFVHGDLRAHNVLVSENNIKVIDWDFAGRDGEVRYPRDLNRGIDLWRPDEAQSLGPIKREHDEAMVWYLLSNF